MTAPRPGPDASSTLADRRARQSRGRWSEMKAAGVLRLKGYRILERRWRSSAGEVDIVALRGKRLAFVEVKHRASTSDDEAHGAVGGRQIGHLYAAADQWLQRNKAHRDYDVGFDLVIVAPGQWPRHIPNAL